MNATSANIITFAVAADVSEITPLLIIVKLIKNSFRKTREKFCLCNYLITL